MFSSIPRALAPALHLKACPRALAFSPSAPFLPRNASRSYLTSHRLQTTWSTPRRPRVHRSPALLTAATSPAENAPDAQTAATGKRELSRVRTFTTMPEMGPDGMPIVPDEDIEEHFVRGSGAGGQKINKTANCVVRIAQCSELGFLRKH